MGDIEMQVWTHEQTQSRWRELSDAWLNFCKCEPMSAAIPRMVEEGDNRDSLQFILRDMMAFNKKIVIVAWDSANKKVAGFLYALVEHAGDSRAEKKEDVYGYDKYKFDADTLTKLYVMVNFLEDFVKKGDVFNRYGVEKAIVIQVTSVCPEYKKRGLANDMTAKVLEVAKEQGFPIATSESTSAFTQHSKIKNFQFEKVIELNYADDYSICPDMPEDIRQTHKTAAILVKRL